MSMQSFERELIAELREVTKNQKIRMKDVMEWSTGDVKPQASETLTRLPSLGVNVAWRIGKLKGV